MNFTHVDIDYIHYKYSVNANEGIICRDATIETIEFLEDLRKCDFSKRSPELRDVDWHAYFEASYVRMIFASRVLNEMKDNGATRLFDYGSFLGNFSRLARKIGFDVTMVDSYALYDGATNYFVSALSEQGFGVFDNTKDRFLENFSSTKFDCGLFLSTIEHIAHSPRKILKAIIRNINEQGSIVIDTPNVGYIGHREKFLKGSNYQPPIQNQYAIDDFFEGHHREYTLDELQWMMGYEGLQISHLNMFNYSVFTIEKNCDWARRLTNLSEVDPRLSEMAFVVAKKSKVTQESIDVCGVTYDKEDQTRLEWNDDESNVKVDAGIYYFDTDAESIHEIITADGRAVARANGCNLFVIFYSAFYKVQRVISGEPQSLSCAQLCRVAPLRTPDSDWWINPAQLQMGILAAEHLGSAPKKLSGSVPLQVEVGVDEVDNVGFVGMAVQSLNPVRFDRLATLASLDLEPGLHDVEVSLVVSAGDVAIGLLDCEDGDWIAIVAADRSELVHRIRIPVHSLKRCLLVLTGNNSDNEKYTAAQVFQIEHSKMLSP